MSLPGAGGPGPGSSSDPAELGTILARLGDEIGHPLDALRKGIIRLMDDPSKALTEPEGVQARTIRTLCDDLDRLTRECLESPGPV